VTIWLHWYGSWKTLVDQGEWSNYLVPNKICKIIMLILVLYHWYVTFWLSNTVLIYLHGFCYFLLFVFLPCWLVGFWIFKWRKTDKNITMALVLMFNSSLCTTQWNFIIYTSLTTCNIVTPVWPTLIRYCSGGFRGGPGSPFSPEIYELMLAELKISDPKCFGHIFYFLYQIKEN
jgi:hypothetical protein